LPSSGPVLWIIDPVDGTSNYARQQPNYSISIAAAVKKYESMNGEWQISAGVVYDPSRDELFSASYGGTSKMNGEPIKVNPNANLESAIIGLDWSREPQERQIMLDTLGRLAHEVHTIRAIGSAALALAWVAAGRLDLYFNLVVGPWDVAASYLLIKQAGGSVTDTQGNPWKLDNPGCIASNKVLHREFLALAGLSRH
jgi:myo-inositol-1(or 4)-monophosphatase